jgi:hypothetical protein
MYSARVLGTLEDDGSWDGAIEFLDDDGRTFVTGVETHQPSLTELIYWSTALTRRYIDGALARARAEKPRARARVRSLGARRPTRRAAAEKPSATRTQRASGVHVRPR